MAHVTPEPLGDRAQEGGARMVVAVVADDTPFCATGAELLADRLFSLGASAVSELATPDGGGLRLVADLPVGALPDLEATGQPFEVLEVDPSWSGGWRDHAVAVAVGERLVVRPAWVAPSPEHDGRIEVVVDAAASFGSGSHATTRLCLAAIESLADRSALGRVLDVGSGTGVLGAAALLLGATSLVAVDIDHAAVEATRRTAALGGVEHLVVESSVRTVADVVDEHGPFDLVLANLLVPIIEQLGPQLASAVAPGGDLVLSGLLADDATGQVDRAIAAVRGSGSELHVVARLDDDGWSAVLLHRD
ncbi:50S ribosomal protein L11 methyltransferase [Dermatobacter hominis]|uniref:50S ribosomal protein L11 methyltransferase n=1 Tax=Dermatobacter hominis TaxID=2884263 RepID=UPI001D12FBBD|nr:50S ribosomal protein L11 methyltransferase [Dermatobacter hominis]UDY37905.1 50S ribosomal protein L11 methyltransferase [Dermatobacter hominis]